MATAIRGDPRLHMAASQQLLSFKLRRGQGKQPDTQTHDKSCDEQTSAGPGAQSLRLVYKQRSVTAATAQKNCTPISSALSFLLRTHRCPHQQTPTVAACLA